MAMVSAAMESLTLQQEHERNATNGVSFRFDARLPTMPGSTVIDRHVDSIAKNPHKYILWTVGKTYWVPSCAYSPSVYRPILAICEAVLMTSQDS